MIFPCESSLVPVVDRSYWDYLSSDTSAQQDEVGRCSEEPWYWLVNYVYTIRRDEGNVDGGARVERFPPKPYLRMIFDYCFRNPKLATDKSRQMVMTWLLVAYEFHCAQFNPYELVVFQSKKEKDADEELVKRADFIWRHQPAWMRPHRHISYCRLEFLHNDSKILGIPSGGDQIRSHNPSRVLIDECGFFEGEFEDCRTAALACCSDIKLVSSANLGQWHDFIDDRLVA